MLSMLAQTLGMERRGILTWKVLVSLCAIICTYSGAYSQDVSFVSKILSGTSGKAKPTTLDFGPDGRLYVAHQTGEIYAYTVTRNSSEEYVVTATESILLVKQIPNHNDDGSINLNETDRQVTGILAVGTPSNPVLYVGSSDPRIGGGGTAGDKNLDTNSGIISRLTWNGSSWNMQNIVIGLPRSEENHANNGMQLDPVNNILYVASGGNTNAGSPSNNFAFLGEFALAAAILTVDLNRIETEFGGSYIIPTLDDPTRANQPNGTDINDPFGGNDGLNQGKIIEGGPVQVYSPGYRNIYDLVLTTTPGKEGRIYTIDNGANGGWGGYPDQEGFDGVSTNVTNNYVVGEPGSNGPGLNDAKVNNKDNLHLVSKPGMAPIYGGHPNPIRANPSGAGWYWYDNNTATAHFELMPTVDWPPVPLSMANPVEGDYRNPGVNDGALYTWPESTNGMAEFTSAKFFNGAMAGDLLAVSFDDNLYRIKLTEDGTAVDFVESIASGFGTTPLDVVIPGINEPYEGTIWVVNYVSKTIVIFEPEVQEKWSYVESSNGSNPTQRHENAFVELNGKFYLLGGRGIKPVNIYDPATATWTQGASSPIELNHFQAVPYNGKIYVMGAFTGGYPTETPVPTIYIYDPVTNTWETGASIPRPRGSAGTVVYNGEIYLIAGITNGHTNGWVPWVDKYNPTTNTWTQLADAPRVRDHFHAGVIGHSIYLAGGRQTNIAGNVFGVTLSEVDVYNLNTNTWNTLPASSNVITKRAGATSVVLNNELYLIGGESSQTLAHNETEVLDPISGSWRSTTPLLTGRHGTQALVYNNQIYIAAGNSTKGGGSELTTMETFTLTIPCSGIYDVNLDDDGDFYSNADEMDNGTNPCSAASTPSDFDLDYISNLNDPDDDNDGIPDLTDAFAQDGSNGLSYPVPLIYPFLNGDPGTGLFGLGFTGLMSNGTSNYEDLYDTSNPDLIMGGAVGLASIPANSGDAVTNDQQYAFQYGALLSSTDKVVIKSRLQGDPFFDGIAIGSLQNQSQGIYIGNGDQDNYIKVVLDANYGNPGIRILGEDQGIVFINEFTAVSGILSSGIIDLYIEIDPTTNSAQFLYKTPLLPTKVTIGSPLVLPALYTNILNGTQAIACGIIASSGLGNDYSATWDFMNISSPFPFLTNPELNYTIGSEETSASIDLLNVFEDDEGDENLTYQILNISENSFVESTSFLGSNLNMTFISGQGGTADFVVRATDQDGYYIDYAFSLIKLLTAPLVNINTGGNSYTGTSESWTMDQYFTGGTPWSKIVPVSGTTDPALYQTERYGNMTYNIPVPEPGLYIAKLGFAEILRNGPGKRVFNVSIENGQHSLTNYDIFQDAGGLGIAIIKEFDLIQVDDGMLTIEFTNVVDNAKISHIQILKYTGGSINLAPVVTNPGVIQTFEGAPFQYQVEAYDPNSGDILTYSSAGLPASLILNSETGLISGTIEAEANTYPVTLIVSDNAGNETTEEFTIVVNVNSTGEFNLYMNSGGPTYTFNNIEWEADQFFSGATNTYKTKVTSIDGTENDELYKTERWASTFGYEIPVPNSGMYEVTLHFAEVFYNVKRAGGVGSRVFNFTLENGQDGIQNYDIFSAAGGSSIAVSETFIIEVIDGILNIDFVSVVDKAKVSGIEIHGLTSGNQPPTITPIEDLVTTYDTPINIPVNAADEGPITLEVSGQPASLVFTDNSDGTGVLAGTIPISQIGTYTVIVTATDAESAFSTEEFQLEVTSGNIAPTLNAIGNQQLTVGKNYEIALIGQDSPNDQLVLSAINLPLFLSLVDNADGTGQLTGSPQPGDEGIYSTTIRVTDAEGLYDEEAITITVNLNSAPAIDGINTQIITTYVNYQLTVSASDIDGDPITFEFTGLPAFLNAVDNADGTASIEGMAIDTDVNVYAVTIRAMDNLGNFSDLLIQFEVVPNNAPIIESITDKVVFLNTTTNFQIVASDTENENITFSIEPSPLSWMAFTDNLNGTADVSLNPVAGDEGLYNFTLSASDVHGNTSQALFTIEIQSTPDFDFKMNTGGVAITNGSENWAPDDYFIGGSTYAKSVEIINSDNDALYSSERYGNMSYAIPVPSPGDYEVTLHFAEVFFNVRRAGGVGSRVFNVSIEDGAAGLQNYDIFSEAGGSLIAIEETFQVNITDGILNITFTNVTNNAKVSGIEIVSLGTGSLLSSINTSYNSFNGENSSIEISNGISLYPNPSKNLITLDITNSESFVAPIQIYDAGGRIVYVKEFDFMEGHQNINLYLDEILSKAGNYYLIIHAKETGTKAVQFIYTK